MIANHGQKIKYHHSIIGCNSRLDTIQAAILNVKLKHLKEYSQSRYNAAQIYTERLKNIEGIITPYQAPYSTHVYHQYTLKIETDRAAIQRKLSENGIPSMIYYPLPLHHQEAFKNISIIGENLDNSEKLCTQVLSLPMHTELTKEEIFKATQALINS